MRACLQEGGLGDLQYPLVADLKKEISQAYGVLSPDGIALRGLFIIDKDGVVQVRADHTPIPGASCSLLLPAVPFPGL